MSRKALLVLLFSLPLGCGDDDTLPPSPDAGAQQCSVALCDDGLFCNGPEACEGTECVVGDVPCPGMGCNEERDICDESCADNDGDGAAARSCGGSDCDDEDPDRYPGNVEVCDAEGHDEDCDPTTFGREDRDSDGQLAARCCNDDGAGNVICGADCNDTLPAVFLGATEICDRYDNDCDGEVDEGVLSQGYVDADGDQHGDPLSILFACPGAAGFSLYADDCDDANRERFAGRGEECNGLDDDCDLEIDEEIVDLTFYRDADSDGFGDPRSETRTGCVAPPGYRYLPLDCDDTESSISPVATEACNGSDDNCDGVADFRIGPADLEDDDGDEIADIACGGEDCEDDDQRVAGLPEVFDGVDNNCDGEVDERCVMSAFYSDEDGDGYGAGEPTMGCELEGRALRDGDCDDSAAEVRPGAAEACNAIDDDCDGLVDEFVDQQCALPGGIGQCVSGQCELMMCARDRLDCDNDPGCETSIFEPSNCGSCGNLCSTDEANAFAACMPVSGAQVADCGYECVDGYGDCDDQPGCERPIDNADNCGGCDIRCPILLNSTPGCEGGVCTTACQSGFDSCDALIEGCETEVRSDPDHCGECHNACSSGLCVGGRCTVPAFPTDGTDDVTTSEVQTYPSGIIRVRRFEVPSTSEVTLSGGTGVLEVYASDEVVIAGTINLSGAPGDGRHGGNTARPMPDLSSLCDPGRGGGGEAGQPGRGENMTCGGGGSNGGGAGGNSGEGGGGGGGFAGGGGGGQASAGGGLGGGPQGGSAGGQGGAAGNHGGGGVATVGCYRGEGGTVAMTLSTGGGGGGSIGQAAVDDLEVRTTLQSGSGGGGGAGSGVVGGGGGGGGGALRIASPVRIVLRPTARILANGGDGDRNGGGGSGGVIHLVAPEIVIEGGAELRAAGGWAPGNGGDGGIGRIRFSVDPSRCQMFGEATPSINCGNLDTQPCLGSVGIYPN